jgi:hypothetical protein
VKDDFKRAGFQKLIGPGGWRCFCCNPWKDKQLSRRYVRRVLRQMDRQQRGI